MNKKSSGEMHQQQLPLAFIRGEAYINKPQDLFIPPDALEVILETFEGPLDLLLYLIKKQKFDILDLPIAPITTQYMHYVELMKNVKLELAAEYLVMAAILAEIKSRLLLPKLHIEDEEVDPRAELVRRLQEYEVIKYAALNLDKLPRMERDFLCVNTNLPENIPMRANDSDVDLMELVSALQDVLKRTQAYEHHHIAKESLSTRERMSKILNILQQHTDNEGFIAFEALFEPKEGRNGVVVTFLALLELLKDHLVECIQTNGFGRINVRAS
ncbi:segregation and condensation protein A [Thalassotalea profundi]|uniref:Segregation and condensation protein A n=1 Tax=Thalassotalea profundi TaxID=2036687 RepID=A0ABQ3IFF9_9GAMM|nr:segregation/condensation protein A [Thalassotalea profundi]GHE79194.1 segregation and condensation protein A [Thalassotalea profundi]